MAEISHVHLLYPDITALNRIIREGGAQLFPQWLSTDFGKEPEIAWWGLRGVLLQALEPPADPAQAGLWPRSFDDWTEPPRGLVLATADADRAAADLEPALGHHGAWWEVGEDVELSARCRRVQLGRSLLVLAEPAGDGYVTDCLAVAGEGPIAVTLDGTSRAGTDVRANPVTDGPARYIRLGPGTAPTLIFLPAGG